MNTLLLELGAWCRVIRFELWLRASEALDALLCIAMRRLAAARAAVELDMALDLATRFEHTEPERGQADPTP